MKKATHKHTNVSQYVAHAATTAVMGRVIINQLDRLADEIAMLKKASHIQPRLLAIRAAAGLMIGGKEEIRSLTSTTAVKKKRRRRRKSVKK